MPSHKMVLLLNFASTVLYVTMYDGTMAKRALQRSCMNEKEQSILTLKPKQQMFILYLGDKCITCTTHNAHMYRNLKHFLTDFRLWRKIFFCFVWFFALCLFLSVSFSTICVCIVCDFRSIFWVTRPNTHRHTHTQATSVTVQCSADGYCSWLLLYHSSVECASVHYDKHQLLSSNWIIVDNVGVYQHQTSWRRFISKR